MFFHLILTGECNSQCRYCFGEAIDDVDDYFRNFDVDYQLPKKIEYDIGALRKFCSKDPDCVLTFYGGEPLLCLEEVMQIMKSISCKHFMIQTNGLLLNRLETEYVNRFHTILVSVDGEEHLTDYYRGKGTFRKILKNLRFIKQNGFEGELIARMTVMEQTDICRQVTWLLNNEEFSFSSVHWQLNAGFWKKDFKRRDFARWVEESYNPGIRKLVKFWVDTMQKHNRVLKLYPLLGIAHDLLHGEYNSILKCGAGWTNFAIQTDGHIIICPTMWGIRDFYLGHIQSSSPLKLRKVFVGAPCMSCDILGLCGGRCLYANITRRWAPEAYGVVCETVRNLITSVQKEIPLIKSLISRGKVCLGDFDYLKYNGCEIIP